MAVVRNPLFSGRGKTLVRDLADDSPGVESEEVSDEVEEIEEGKAQKVEAAKESANRRGRPKALVAVDAVVSPVAAPVVPVVAPVVPVAAPVVPVVAPVAPEPVAEKPKPKKRAPLKDDDDHVPFWRKFK